MTDEMREALEWIESYAVHGDISMEELGLGIDKIASDCERAGDSRWKPVKEVAARLISGDGSDWEPLLRELKAALARII